MGLRDWYERYLPDPYPAEERAAIQSEEDLPIEDDPPVPGWENVVPISPEAYHKMLLELLTGGKHGPDTGTAGPDH